MYACKIEGPLWRPFPLSCQGFLAPLLSWFYQAVILIFVVWFWSPCSLWLPCLFKSIWYLVGIMWELSLVGALSYLLVSKTFFNILRFLGWCSKRLRSLTLVYDFIVLKGSFGTSCNLFFYLRGLCDSTQITLKNDFTLSNKKFSCSI